MWLQLRQNSWRLILCVNELNICICMLCVCVCVFVFYIVFVTGTNPLFVSGGKMFISHRGTHIFTQINIFTHKEGQSFLYWGSRWGKICVHLGEEGQSFLVVCRARANVSRCCSRISRFELEAIPHGTPGATIYVHESAMRLICCKATECRFR